VLWREHIASLIAWEVARKKGNEERDRTPWSHTDEGVVTKPGKFWVYERVMRIPYYGIYEINSGRLEVYRLIGGYYRLLELNERGNFAIATDDSDTNFLTPQAQQQIPDLAVQRDLINLIETIIVYKLPQKSREEIAAMLNLSELKQTRFYQEVKQEGLEEGLEQGLQQGKQEGERLAKLEAIRRMIALGLNSETIAQILDFPVEFVRQTINKIQRESMSVSERAIDSFIELLTQQPSLFSSQQLTELAQLIEPLPDEIDVLSAAIATWSENKPAIAEAQSKLLEPLPPSNASEKVSPTPESSESTGGDRLNKQTLNNAILL
jgi:flagellar biosynthesis/type III secretory pathway protein FliH